MIAIARTTIAAALVAIAGCSPQPAGKPNQGSIGPTNASSPVPAPAATPPAG